MIAQVGATPAPLERQQRHHEPPADAGVGHTLAELLPAGVLAAAQVVIELPAGTELFIQTKNDTVLYAVPTTEG